MTAETALRLRAITKSFGKTDVLNGIDLEVRRGEFVVFVGPSGCGKSTLLRTIAGLETQTAGTVEIAGRAVDALPPARRGIAMVFQTYALYPHLTVSGNMTLALKEDGVSAPERERRVAEAARLLALEPLLGRRPAELSGGQRQRVAIGRAIVREPDLFLFDEPLSNLDAALRVQTRLEIARLHRTLGATMVYVTHDQTEAMTLADRIVVLNGGRVEQVGSPLELYRNPANLFVATFIGSPRMNILEGAPASRLGAARIGVRPEHFVLLPDGAPEDGESWTGQVRHAEHLGSDTFVYVALSDGQDVAVRVPGDAEVAVDAPVRLRPRADRIHRFDADGRTMPR